VATVISIAFVRVRGLLVEAHHEHPAAPVGEHVDLGLVEPRKVLAGDDLARGADRDRAARDVHHPVGDLQQRIDVVGDQNDGQSVTGAQLARGSGS
jgi:hypothetical protein